MKKNLAGFILTISALLLSAGFLTAQNGLKGNPAPAFTAVSLNGKTVSLNDFKGSVVILNFWATWCPPCRAEIPEFVQFSRDFETKNVRIIGLSVNDKDDALRKFVAANRINYTIIDDSKNRITSLYGGIRAIPTTFIIDRKGIIREMVVGGINKKQLTEMVEPYLEP